MHPNAGLAAGPAGRDAATPRYRAFISYSHADTPWANWLMGKLEGYRVPVRFQGRAAPVGEIGPRLAPVFRDRDELPTTSDLGETIRTALRESATLIVICSPSSAKSRWVQEEICAFKRLHGERRVFAFIVAGEPKVAGAADDCFSPALRCEVAPDGTLTGAPAEVIAADARPHGDGRATAFVRLVAGLLGVGFDELRQRELQRRNRRLTLIAAASAVGMVITLGLAISAWRARNEAELARNDARRRLDQAEDVLAFMLGDFRDDLKKVGQLPLLAKVGDKALKYFDVADPRDLTDTALNRQAKALTQIGEVRLLQKDVRYAEAAKVFFAAYQRASELAARHPRDSDILFERAQAEFWIGNTHFTRGDFGPASVWLSRYRDSAAALVALDPANVKWRLELIYGRHALGALDVQRGQLAAARAGFLAEIEAVRQLLANDPKNTELRYELTQIDSFLGTIGARSGDFAESQARFATQRAGLEALLQAEPTSAQWSSLLVDCLIWNSRVLTAMGQVGTAGECLTRCQQVLAPLLLRDPANRRWVGTLAMVQVREAELAATTDASRAIVMVGGAREKLERLLAVESKDRLFEGRLVTALTLEARLRLELGRPDAMALAVRAVEIADRFAREPVATDQSLGEAGRVCVVAGQIAAAAGRREEAARYWSHGFELLAPRLRDSRDWWVIDPAARSLTLLGRAAEAREFIERLQKLGYVPLEPWPAPRPLSSQ